MPDVRLEALARLDAIEQARRALFQFCAENHAGYDCLFRALLYMEDDYGFRRSYGDLLRILEGHK